MHQTNLKLLPTMTNEQNSRVPPVKLPKYLYSLRVDLFHNKKSETLLLKWIENYNVAKYLCAREFKKIDKTPHYQCAIWFHENPTGCNARNFWRNKTISSKGGHAFRIARNPASLAKYCNDKEKYGLLTNLTKEEILQVGTWKNAKQETKRFNEKLDIFLKKISDTNNIIDKYGYPNVKCSTLEIINKITDFCYDNDRNGLANHHMLNVLRKHKLIDTSTYCLNKYPIVRSIENTFEIMNKYNN